MKSVNVKELKQLIDANELTALIDVREQFEYQTGNLQGDLIPMNEIPNRFQEIPREGQVVIHCRSGARSANVIAWLEQNHGYKNLYNLEGGIIAWSQEIDSSVKY